MAEFTHTTVREVQFVSKPFIEKESYCPHNFSSSGESTGRENEPQKVPPRIISPTGDTKENAPAWREPT